MINEIGEVQNRGYILALKCDFNENCITVAAISDNIINCSWIKLKSIGELLSSDINLAFESQVVSTVTSLLLKYRSLEETKLKMASTSASRYQITCSNSIIIDSHHLCFSIIECSTSNIYLFEIEEIQSVTPIFPSHAPHRCQVRLSRNTINRINRSVSAEEVTAVFCDAALEILADCDMVWTVKFTTDSSSIFVNGKHRDPLPSFDFVGKLPPGMVRKPHFYLNKCHWRFVYDLNQSYSKVYSVEHELIDLSMTNFITVTKPCQEFLSKFGIRSGIAVVIVVNGTVWGMYMLTSIGKLMAASHEQYALLESIASTSALRLASILRGDHFAQMAHEIRNPLHGIISTLQILQSDIYTHGPAFGQNDTSDSTSGFIESALLCCQTMLATLNETLTARKESSCNDLVSPIHLHNLLSTVIRVLKPFSIRKSVVLDCREGNFINSHQVMPFSNNLTVLGEETRITQILCNLVGNAIKFTPEHGSVAVHVSYMPFSSTEHYWNSIKTPYASSYITSSVDQPVVVESTTSSYWVVLEVVDTGCGVSEASMQIMFEPFQQLKYNSNNNGNTNDFQQGDGLGLHIVRQHVRAMNGVLCIASTLGVGSLFFCAFPAQPCSLSGNVERSLNGIGSQPALHNEEKTCFAISTFSEASIIDRTSEGSGHQPTEKLPSVALKESALFPDSTSIHVAQVINANNSTPCAPTTLAIFLVVDDSPLNLRLLQRKIELAFDKASGIECITATNGSVAVDTYMALIRDRKHQLLAGIFMDYHMPVCNGADAISQIRAIEQSTPMIRSVHIIGFTADVSEKSNKNLLDSGANEILPKPTPSGHVESTCRNLVQTLTNYS